ncbi:Kinesin heavy chain [Oleoguttula sp. CCFEE 6159]|nr:Kinesin heavy chain [Oleoguttula sp. CCFEE 6159]
MASYNTIKGMIFRQQDLMNRIELSSGGQPIVEFETDDTCNIKSGEAAGAFTFDRVFSMTSTQSSIFDFSIRPTVDDILQGYNGTVFAYGQTGAGKSYTMMGVDIDDPVSKGIIPRIVEQIFASILSSPGNIEYTVRVSYMEIYMERIRDLLVPDHDNLPIHEDKSRGIYVKGLDERYVSSVQEVYEVMRIGGLARATAATNMNQESSRSHSIFVITVGQKNVETGAAKSGQLFLVDLAGSEKVGKTGASGQTLEEAKKINKSLSALGMVINSLTDGKSTHIPYRDSKLTRILQESLGGNSRTTLIINCSPSSYNDQETLNTLRFGVRAKAIKNKAKVNVELSPAELKNLLKKAQLQNATFENYISGLEGEVQQWRNGDSVPRDKWILSVAQNSARPQAKPRSETPNRLQTGDRRPGAETPGTPRPDSQMDTDRASTPSIPLERDEREEFLRRENELQDQLAERETQVAAADKALQEAKGELQELREREKGTSKDNEKLAGEVEGLKMQVEKVAFESKEAAITMDGLKEANAELTAELDEVKQQLLDTKMAARETGAVHDEKEKLKKERMAEMMAGFDLGADIFSDNERTIRSAIEQLDSLHEVAAAGEAVAPDELATLRQRLLETQGIVRQTELAVAERTEQDNAHIARRSALEDRLATVERAYEASLEQNLSSADVEDIKARLFAAYSNRDSAQVELLDELKADLARRTEENALLKQELDDAQARLKAGAAIVNGQVNGAVGKTVQQQIAEFDVMKKSLMRDLQNRCERVVELEISLDTTREQYASVLRSSSSRQQQKKLAFLERNLEQLTQVQRQLVEQNGMLKKEVAIAERKLAARTERIGSLEALLGESQEKLTAANGRFEAQLTAVKERLEAAKLGSTRGLLPSSAAGGAYGAGMGYGGSYGNGNGVAFGAGVGSRIAKPLRGGGGGGAYVGNNGNGVSTSMSSHNSASTDAHSSRSGSIGAGGASHGRNGSVGAGGGGSGYVPTLAGLASLQQERERERERDEGAGKRSSWFFNQRA